ncbi:hypothetical protein B0H67DRAFT_586402 [Lasiosphaeris hirsuta]|uniref:Uncharacterized protein n=1 Tax=Lasiosphaeris hirsuta TaxID=260670 RepID=A0AA40A9P5_9PEZI|nr:hypothetical protein B0H67DRAFT_586402 [Lasiosphaeris hirsuta]
MSPLQRKFFLLNHSNTQSTVTGVKKEAMPSDPRVHQVNKALRAGDDISKAQLLRFLEVHPTVYHASITTRDLLLKWLKKNSKQVHQWLPDIFKVSPDFLENPVRVALGLVDTPTASILTGEPGPGPSVAANFTKELPDLGHFGSKTPQQAWLDDVTEARDWLDHIRGWCAKMAESFLEAGDEIRPAFIRTKDQIPNFSDKVRSVQTYIDSVKKQQQLEHEARESRKRKRSMVPSLLEFIAATNAAEEDHDADEHGSDGVSVGRPEKRPQVPMTEEFNSFMVQFARPAEDLSEEHTEEEPQVTQTEPMPGVMHGQNPIRRSLRANHRKPSRYRNGTVYSSEDDDDNDDDNDSDRGADPEEGLTMGPSTSPNGANENANAHPERNIARPRQGIELGVARRPPSSIPARDSNDSGQTPGHGPASNDHAPDRDKEGLTIPWSSSPPGRT